MPCYLRISGNFEPDQIVDSAPTEFEIRHRKGDPDRKGSIRDSALIQFVVSGADFADADEPFQDVVGFVRRYGDELKTFCRRPEFESLVFDFGFPYDPQHPVFWRTVPEKVVAAAAVCSAGIELSFYSVARFESG